MTLFSLLVSKEKKKNLTITPLDLVVSLLTSYPKVMAVCHCQTLKPDPLTTRIDNSTTLNPKNLFTSS